MLLFCEQAGNALVDVVESIALELGKLNAQLELVPGDPAHIDDVAIGQNGDRLGFQDGDREAGLDFHPAAGSRGAHAGNELFDGFEVTTQSHAGAGKVGSLAVNTLPLGNFQGYIQLYIHPLLIPQIGSRCGCFHPDAFGVAGFKRCYLPHSYFPL